MFFFCKRPSITVNFYTDNQAAYNFAKPVNAAKFIPDWWRGLQKTTAANNGEEISTLKLCNGFTNLYSTGVMLPMWSDLRVDIGPDGSWKYLYADRQSSAETHPVQQIGCPDVTDKYTHLKLINPWIAKEKTGVKFALNAPFWNLFGFEDICVPPGIVDFKVSTAININLFFKKQQELTRYNLKFGQPLAHLVPLTEKKVKYNYELVSTAEHSRLISGSGITLFFSNRIKQARKLCPYAK